MAAVTVGKILYGALFIVVVPALLVQWAVGSSANVSLPTYGTPLLGWVFVALGLVLMLTAMLELWRFGGGLPMNAFPPPNLVSRGTFRWLPHPIYTGFVILCLGISMAAQSSSGLWLVTPAVAIACAALVFGYERPDLARRFGRTLQILPPDDDAVPSMFERLQFLLLVVGPWLALYELTVNLPSRGFSFGFAFEENLPLYSWTTLVYQSTYVTVAIAPWCARTRSELRKLMISGWTATALVFPIYWIFPSSAPRRPLFDDNWLAASLLLERDSFPPVAAFPSFHVLWAVFVARLYRPRWLGIGYVAAIAMSCITTGMHFIADVVGAVAIAPLLLAPQRAWEVLRSAAERLANSWREWRLGPVRIINHGAYAAAAGFIHVLIVMAILGPGNEWKVLVTAAAGLVGSGIWAQWLEGSSRLRRPFGFYGGLVGVGLACLFFPERWLLLAAHCVSAPWIQSTGRLRCLVNGCCHGRAATPAIGIRVIHPRSRVAYLADLAGVPIHATQLYSILGNIALGMLLARLWISGCPLSLIVGIYGIGSGVARFAEEAYRGEPQTPNVLGLRVYQWIAVGVVITGAVMTTLRSAPAASLSFTWLGFWLAFVFAGTSGAAMGVDFPESERPLARLT